MEKILKTCLIGCFALLVTILCAQETIRKPADEAYVHSGTGMSFPARIDSFEKTKVRISKNPLIGTDVSYENEDGSIADVYLYDDKSELETLMRETNLRILDSPKASDLIRSVESIPFSGPELPQGVLASEYRITLQSEVLTSRLYLFKRNGFAVKVRITWSPGDSAEQESADHFGIAIMNADNTVSEQNVKIQEK